MISGIFAVVISLHQQNRVSALKKISNDQQLTREQRDGDFAIAHGKRAQDKETNLKCSVIEIEEF